MIEIDLQKLQRGTREGRVRVERGGKVFYRRQRVGQKKQDEVTSSSTVPNPTIMEGISQAVAQTEKFGSMGGAFFSNVNAETGEFTYQAQSYMNYSGEKPEMVKPLPVNFQLKGRTIVRTDDKSCVTIPEEEIEITKKALIQSSPAWFSTLAEWGGSVKHNFDDFKNNSDAYNEKFSTLDNFEPEMKSVVSPGKYSKAMKCVYCNNTHQARVTKPYITAIWYGGNREDTKVVGEAIQEVFKGNYNKDNVIQQQMPLMIKTAQKVNKDHGEDTIFRGETNVKASQDILNQLDEFGDVDLADKTFSCTENEKLARWYATVHNQESARGVKSKTHLMLKIPREKFEDKVVMDHRSTGETMRPEQEVTIVGNDVSLTGDEVMVNAVTPKRKRKKWLTYNQFKQEGGTKEDLIVQMVGEA